MTVRFSTEDLENFAAASHDRNPLHLSEIYARKTPFGQPVVFGALGVLALLARMPAPAGQRVAKLSAEFPRPLFAGVDYRVVVNGNTGTISDGSTVLVKVELVFADGQPQNVRLRPPAQPTLSAAATPQDTDFVPGLQHEGEYDTNLDAARRLAEQFGLDVYAASSLPISTLLWASYFVGMVLPGERALFYRLLLRFHEPAPAEGLLRWSCRVLSKNALNLLRSEVSLSVGGSAVADGEVGALVRPPAIGASVNYGPQSRDLEGKTAVVIGASRGLGSAIAASLVSRGATVIATFQHSQQEADHLADQMKTASGRILLRKGNASDPAWCESLRAEHGPIDFLLLNACPTILPLRLEAETVERVNSYLLKAFELVSVPLSVLAGSVEGWIGLISSIYVETAHKDFPHYVAAKAAAEALFRAAAQQYRKPGYMIVRPPKLLTDMTNTPYGRGDAQPPGTIAAKIVDRFCSGAAAVSPVEYLDLS